MTNNKNSKETMKEMEAKPDKKGHLSVGGLRLYMVLIVILHQFIDQFPTPGVSWAIQKIWSRFVLIYSFAILAFGLIC